MCRFLMMRGAESFTPQPVLAEFTERCRESAEYQGDGFGLTWRENGRWSRYRALEPIWTSRPELPDAVDFLVVHARSAFRDSAIELASNMPFYRDPLIFVFNGELHGVKLRVPGRIGAEKVFHLVQQSMQRHDGDLDAALSDVDRLLARKSDRVRALNIALTDGERIYANCRFDESPDYFTLHVRRGALAAVCSEPLDASFEPIANGEHVFV